MGRVRRRGVARAARGCSSTCSWEARGPGTKACRPTRGRRAAQGGATRARAAPRASQGRRSRVPPRPPAEHPPLGGAGGSRRAALLRGEKRPPPPAAPDRPPSPPRGRSTTPSVAPECHAPLVALRRRSTRCAGGGGVGWVVWGAASGFASEPPRGAECRVPRRHRLYGRRAARSTSDRSGRQLSCAWCWFDWRGLRTSWGGMSRGLCTTSPPVRGPNPEGARGVRIRGRIREAGSGWQRWAQVVERP